MNRALIRLTLGTFTVASLLSCAGSMSDEQAAPTSAESVSQPSKRARGGGGKKDKSAASGDFASEMEESMDAPMPAAPPSAAPGAKAAEEPKPMDAAPDDAEAEPAATRSWFPETFLFDPLVVTDDQGNAEVSVTVPDQLTTWRVLGLAWSQAGGLAGATHNFQGTLPIYVDPVVPPTLRQGDRVRVPVQVVNTTGASLTSPLSVVISDGQGVFSRADSAVTVRGNGTVLHHISVQPRGVGPLTLRVGLGTADAIENTVDVRPVGRPLVQARGGTLGAARHVTLTGADDLELGASRARLVVYPGALAVLRSELATAGSRDGFAGAAYGLRLAGTGSELLTDLGIPADSDEGREATTALRDLGIRSSQRAIRAARAPDVAAAALLVTPALSHPDNGVMSRLGDRLLQTLRTKQLPDGTFGGDAGSQWTLQRILVTTADVTRAAQTAAALPAPSPEDARLRDQAALAIRLSASGAFERHQGRLLDGYTAASVLASGAVDGDLEAVLIERVLNALTNTPDGARALVPEKGVLRSDGRPPSTVEATAVAAIALVGRADADVLADLGTTVLGGWRPGAGWGDGRADLAGLDAVLALFKQPLPESIALTLSVDGRVIGERTLTRDALRDLSVIDADPGDARGTHEWEVKAEPAVPGLGYALSLHTWVPWPDTVETGGLGLRLRSPDRYTVGQPAHLQYQGSAPPGRPLMLRAELPAGVQVDGRAMDAQVDAGLLQSWRDETGAVELRLPPLVDTALFNAELVLLPTLAGELHSGATTLSLADDPDIWTALPPTRWTVR